MSASDVEAITPDVSDRLLRAVGQMPNRERPTFPQAHLVLWHIARSARRGLVTESLDQIAAGTLLSIQRARLCLAAIELAGLIRPVRGAQ